MITTYDGGKNGSGTYQQIINFMPYHTWYMELFLGSGAIFRYKLAADNSILMDMDQGVINEWKNSDIDFFKAMANISIIHGNAIHFLQTSWPFINHLHNSGFPVMVYLDPPYPIFTRRSKKAIYKHELSDNDHRLLLDAVRNLKCYVMISSYKNKMYDEHLKAWNIHQFVQQTRVGTSTECLYMNYEKPTVLHDYRYLGRDFREREAIKGQRKRIVDKFLRMDKTQRNDIISELNRMLE